MNNHQKWDVKIMVKNVLFILTVVSIMWRGLLPVFTTSFGNYDIGMVLSAILFLYSISGILTKLRNDKKDRWNIFAFLVPLAIFILYGFLTLVFTIDVLSTFKGMVRYVFSFALVVSFAFLVSGEQDILVIAKSIMISAVIIALLAVFESVAGIRFIPNQDYNPNYYQIKNALGFLYPYLFFHNTNNLSTLLLVSLPACLYVTKKTSLKRSIRNLLKVLFAALFFFVAILAETRGVMIGIILVFLAYSIGQQRIVLRKRFVAVVLLILATTLLLILSYYNIDVSKMFNYGRLSIWRKTYQNCVRTNFLGAGIANSSLYNSLYGYELRINDIHNYWLELLLDAGLVGFFAFTVWYIGLARGVVKLHQKTRSSLSTMFLSFLFVYPVITIIPSSIRTFDLIWIMLGCCGWLMINQNKLLMVGFSNEA